MKLKMNRFLAILLCLVLCCSLLPATAFAIPSSGNTYYVANFSAGGNDTTGTGDETTPFLTIGKALQAAIDDGADSAEVILLSDINLSSEFKFEDYSSLSAVTIHSVDGDTYKIQFSGVAPIGDTSGLLKVTGNRTVTFENITLAGTTGEQNGRVLYIAGGAVVNIGAGVTVTGGRMITSGGTEGGAGAYVGNGSALVVSDDAAFIGNVTDANGGAILVKDGGSVTISDSASFTGNNANNGAALYIEAMTSGKVQISDSVSITGNRATAHGGGIYVRDGAIVSVEGMVEIQNNNAGANEENVYLQKDNATFDISGTTVDASIGITCEEPFYYKLVSAEDSYSIEPTTSGDEAGWSYDDGSYVIRYMVYGGVPGLYLFYQTFDMEFSDVTNLDSIQGPDINTETIDYLADEATLPSSTLSADGVTLTVADTVVIGDGNDLVINLACDPDLFRIPDDDVISVQSGGDDVPFTYTYDVEAGTAVITIASTDKDAITDTLVFSVTPEEYFDLTVNMEGPLYTLETSITGRTETILNVVPVQTGTDAVVTVTSDGNPVPGITVKFCDASTNAVVNSQVTDAEGKVYFSGLDASASYYPALYYSNTYQVIQRETITIQLSTLPGQQLDDTAAVTPDSVTSTYDASTGAATLSNIGEDASATYRIKSNADTITFIGNEGDATTAPATVTPTTKQMEASAVTYGELASATLLGYTFEGWFTEADGGDLIEAATPYDTDTSVKTLYAHWTANTDIAYGIQYWVEYAPDGVNAVGTNGDVSTTKTVGGVTYYLYDTAAFSDGTADAEKDITGLGLTEMTDATYTWWTIDGFTVSFESPCVVAADGTSVFSVYYDRNTYNIIYDEDSLSTGTAVHEGGPLDNTPVKFGDKIGTMEDPTLDGYDFAGWYDTEDGVTPSTEYDEDDIFNQAEDLTVYAHWIPHIDTKWRVVVVTQDVKQNPDGTWGTADTWTQFKTVALNNDGSDFSAETDTVKTLTIADVDALNPAAASADDPLKGFTYVGFSADYQQENPTYTVSPDTAEIYVLADGTGMAYLYYSRNTKVVDAKDPETGDDYDDAEIVYGGTFEGQFPDDPNRPGYDFDGWKDGDGNPIEDTTSASPYIINGELVIEINPIWVAREYELTYIPGEGNTFVPSPGKTARTDPNTPGGYKDGTIVVYDQQMGTMPSAKATGYTFIEWRLDPTDPTSVITPTTVVTIDNVVIEDTVTPNAYENTRPLHAYYEPHIYHLHLNPGESPVTHNPATVSVTDVDVEFNAAIAGLPIPVLEGYTFVTWFFRVGDEIINIKNGDIWDYATTNGSTIQVYAAYTPNTYRYDFDLNDVTVGNGSTEAALVDTTIVYAEETFDAVYDGVFAVEATRPGYDFNGWSLTRDGDLLTGEDLVALAEDSTVYAKWTPKKYPVYFVYNGGEIVPDSWTYPDNIYEIDDDTDMIIVTFDTTVGDLPEVEKERAIFTGWKADAPGWPAINGKLIDTLPQFVDATDEKVVLTAQYDYIIRFDPDGGEFVPDGGEDPIDKPQSELVDDGKLPEVTKDDYTFVDWAPEDDPDNPITFPEVVGSDEPLDLVPIFSPNVTFDANGGKVDGEDTRTYALSDLTKLPTPVRNDYNFKGWFTARENGDAVTLDGLKAANVPATVYAHWEPVPRGGGGGGGGGVSSTPITLTVTTDDGADVDPIGVVTVTKGDTKVVKITLKDGYLINKILVDGKAIDPVLTYTFEKMEESHTFAVYTMRGHELDGLTQDHIRYIIGYAEDGLVHPERNLTRAQMAAIIYRLLEPSVRNSFKASPNPFEDVSANDWFVTEVSTLAGMGIVIGRTETEFAPNEPITRAELVTMLVRFLDNRDYDGEDLFNDIDGHWAQKFINLAASKQWIEGYGDGTFLPDQNITRAETMAIVNRALYRDQLNSKSFCEGMVTFPDNTDTAAWYYFNVQEATNGHHFTRDEKGIEVWDKILDTPVP